MVALARLWVLVAAIIVLSAAAGITLVFLSSGSSHDMRAAVQPSVAAPSATGALSPSRTPPVPYTPSDLLRSEYGRIFASAAAGGAAGEQILVATLADLGATTGLVIVWQDGAETKTQVLPLTERGDVIFGGLLSHNSAVIQAVAQRREGRRELGIVYDATAYGSGSPTAHFALLRLEGETWKVVWDVGQAAAWRGSHGRVEFPNGDLSELVVHADSFSEGADELSGVLFEANAGPHRQFVDTWARDGDGYTRRSTETVPSAYATLVAFLYALGTGDAGGATALVTDAALVPAARGFGLDGAMGKNWMISCDLSDCTAAGPIGFYSGPPVKIFFEQRGSAWLISDIQPTAAP